MSPNYAFTSFHHISLDECFWYFHCGFSLLLKLSALSFWDIFLSWYFFYFSDHSLLASYVYTKAMVIHRVLISWLWIFIQLWSRSMYYPTTLNISTGISRLSKESKVILSLPLQIHFSSGSFYLGYWYHQGNMYTRSSLTCNGTSKIVVVINLIFMQYCEISTMMIISILCEKLRHKVIKWYA